MNFIKVLESSEGGTTWQTWVAETPGGLLVRSNTYAGGSISESMVLLPGVEWDGEISEPTGMRGRRNAPE